MAQLDEKTFGVGVLTSLLLGKKLCVPSSAAGLSYCSKENTPMSYCISVIVVKLLGGTGCQTELVLQTKHPKTHPL